MIYRFDAFTLDVAARSLENGTTPKHVERQVFDILCLLIENRTRVVTRDELIEKIWGGRIVSEAAISTRINATRRAVEDDGRKQKIIQTVTGAGFRFVAKVVASEARSFADDANASGIAEQAMLTQSEVSDLPSLAVLPFMAVADPSAPRAQLLGDGIAEEIVTILSKTRWLFLVAAGSSLTIREPSADVTSSARSLGVRYLLRGSFRASGDRIRLTVTLIDGSRGATLSSWRYDAQFGDPFDLIDEVSRAVVGELLPDISLRELQLSRRRSPKHFGVWTRYLQALQLLRDHTRENCAQAILLLEQVSKDQPDFALAYARLATARLHQGLFGWSAEPREALFDLALADAQRALSLDPAEAQACDALASAYQFIGDLDRTEHWARKAIELNPSCVAAYGTLATALAMKGDANAALDVYRALQRISPRDPDMSSALMGACIAHFILGDYAAAADAAREHAVLRPNWYGNKTFLAASLAFLGDHAAAAKATEQLVALFPDYTVSRHRRNTLLRRTENIERLLDGLRSAGLPE